MGTGVTAAISGLPYFLLYFAIAVALVALYLFVYALVTAHNEFALIRQNVLSAALSLGCSLIAFALPLSSAIVHARNSGSRSEEHTSELQSRQYLVCRLLLEKKKITTSSVLH